MSERFITTWYLKGQTITHPWAFLQDFFTPDECGKIKEIAQQELSEAALITGSAGIPDPTIRKNTIRFLNSGNSKLHWAYRRITDGVMLLNKEFWNFNLDYIETLQYTTYQDVGDHYAQHMDMSYNSIHLRKLSFSLQLDDPSTYEGSDLEIVIGARSVNTKRDQGALIVFPSYQMHRVTPLVSGERNSLVGWVCGPAFK